VQTSSSAKSTWNSGLDVEIGFWSRWFTSKGLEWPEDYKARLDPELPLQPFLADHLGHVAGDEVSILEVGAGPLTTVGRRWGNKKVRITAVDPLADHYDRIIERHGVVPPVRTTWCHGELLTERFPRSSFDLVWAINSLDHSYDPVRIISQALDVVKVGSYVLLQHSENEGEREAYEGLHQWNFSSEHGNFTVTNKKGCCDVSSYLRPRAEVFCLNESGVVTVKIRKLR
jgi:SAM-dependent methyltransferase